MTDVLGICESWEADGLASYAARTATASEIAVADIVSGKPVPPRPSMHHRFGAEEADRLALPGWQPVESERLGDWVLRASGGFSSRGNSVLALGDPACRSTRPSPGSPGGTPTASLPPRAHVHPGPRRPRPSAARAGRRTTRRC